METGINLTRRDLLSFGLALVLFVALFVVAALLGGVGQDECAKYGGLSCPTGTSVESPGPLP